jgi:hypothetical protein
MVNEKRDLLATLFPSTSEFPTSPRIPEELPVGRHRLKNVNILEHVLNAPTSLSHCDHLLDRDSVRQEGFILIHCFKESGPCRAAGMMGAALLCSVSRRQREVEYAGACFLFLFMLPGS